MASKAPLFSKQLKGFGAAVLLAGATVLGMSLRGEPRRQVKFEVGKANRPTVSPLELASWGIEGRRDYVVVDMRPDADFKAGHVRGAVNCGTCHTSTAEGKKAQEGDAFVDLTKKMVLYTESGTESVQLPKLLAENQRIYVLAGGYQAWTSQVMAKVAFGGETDEAQILAKKKREAVRAFYAGERPDTGHTATLPVAPIKRDSSHAPAKPTEGC